MENLTLLYAKKVGATDQEIEMLESYLKEINKLEKKHNFFEKLSNKLFNREYSLELFCEELASVAKLSTLSVYTFYFIFYVMNFKRLHEVYKKNLIDEKIYFDTVKGLFDKSKERKIIDLNLGIDSISWPVEFFRLNRFRLGRLEYNTLKFPFESYTKNGITVKKGDITLDIHIPAGTKLDRQTRMDSYKKAYDFFTAKGLFTDGIMKATSHTWMLYPEYLKIFDKKSNLYDFYNDFDVFSVNETINFEDGWRVFGGCFNNEFNDLPKESSLQRAFIEYFKSSRKFGLGYGMIYFDGEKIINKD